VEGEAVLYVRIEAISSYVASKAKLFLKRLVLVKEEGGGSETQIRYGTNV
jgi:hypothetical protein